MKRKNKIADGGMAALFARLGSLADQRCRRQYGEPEFRGAAKRRESEKRFLVGGAV